MLDTSMKKIPLTQGQYTIVDDEDFEMLSKWKWGLRKSWGGRRYAVRWQFVPTSERGGRKRYSKDVYLHRYLMEVTERNIFVDHINGDSLDNRKKNLRLCTQSQNQCNRGPSKKSSSGYKGVTFLKREGLWRATIKYQNKTYRKDRLQTKELAALAYNKMAKELHGEFAYQNKVR